MTWRADRRNRYPHPGFGIRAGSGARFHLSRLANRARDEDTETPWRVCLSRTSGIGISVEGPFFIYSQVGELRNRSSDEERLGHSGPTRRPASLAGRPVADECSGTLPGLARQSEYTTGVPRRRSAGRWRAVRSSSPPGYPIDPSAPTAPAGTSPARSRAAVGLAPHQRAAHAGGRLTERASTHAA